MYSNSTRRISLFLVILILFNFIMPSRAYSAGNGAFDLNLNGTNGSYSLDLMNHKPSVVYTGGRAANITVASEGLYTFTVSGSDPLGFSILEPDHNGANISRAEYGHVLPIATYQQDDGSYYSLDNLVSTSSTSRTVTVRLKAGVPYVIPVFQEDYGSVSLSVSKVNVATDKIVEISDLSVNQYALNSAVYTGDGFATEVDYYQENGFPAGDASGLNNGSGYDYAEFDADVSNSIKCQGTNTKTLSEIGQDAPSSGDSDANSSANEAEDNKANAIQKVVTWLLIYGVADQIRNILSLFVGEVSIDDLVFNQYKYTKLAFYPENSTAEKGGQNPYLGDGSSSGILKVVNDYFNMFRGIAFIFYLIMLLYVGVRILLGSTGREKDKYKTMLTDWVVGILMLALFPIAIKYLIILNEELVSIIKVEVRDKTSIASGFNIMPKVDSQEEAMLRTLGTEEDPDSAKDLMSYFRIKSLKTYNLGYVFVYFFLIKEIFGFLLIYYKRLITIVFLIVLFPFVAMSYVFDKVKDGQAQIFNQWFKELLLNIYTQLFQAILYCAIIFIILALMGPGTSGKTVNIILIFVGLGYLRKGDALLRALFPSPLKGGGAGTVKDVATSVKAMVDIKVAQNFINTAKGVTNRVSYARKKVSEAREKVYNHRENQNRDNKAKRDARLEQATLNQASSVENLRLNFRKAMYGIDSTAFMTPKEKEDYDKLSPEEKQKKDLEIRREGLNLLGYAKDSKDFFVQNAYNEFINGLTPEERKKLLGGDGKHGLIEANEAINMVITGKARDGVELTQQDINIQAKILYDISCSDDPMYGDLKAWMATKTIMDNETVYHMGNDATGHIITREEAMERKRKGQAVFEEKTVTKTRLSDYYGVTKDASGDVIGVGKGLQGKVLYGRQSHQKEMLERDFGNATVKVPMSTRKMMEDVRDDVSAQAKTNSLIATHTKATYTDVQKAEVREASELSVKLARLQNPETRANMTDEERRNSIIEEEKITKRITELYTASSVARDVISETTVVQKKAAGSVTSKKQKEELIQNNSDKLDTAVQTFAGSGTDEDKQAVRKVAELTLQLKKDLTSGKKTRSTELLELTTQIRQIRETNSAANKFAEAMTHERTTGDININTETMDTFGLDLDYSLEAIETIAAREVIEQNDILPNRARKEYTKMAVASIKREKQDEVAQNIVNTSSLDDIISGDTEVDDEGFLDSLYEDRIDERLEQMGVPTSTSTPTAPDGRIDVFTSSYNEDRALREMKMKQLRQIQHEDRIQQNVDWYTDGNLQKTRGAMARATSEAVGATLSATGGNILQVASATEFAAMTAGVQKDPSLRNAAASAKAGMNLESKAEKIVPGARSNTARSLGTLEAQGIEAVSSYQRKSNKDELNPKIQGKAYATEARRRNDVFQNRLDDYHETHS